MTEPRSWRIRLPYERPPLNLNQSWAHFAAKAKVVKEVRLTAGLLFRSNRIPPLTKARIRMEWVVPDRRARDTDNTVLTLKPVADAMVDVGILHDDTPQYISKDETIITYEKGVKALYVTITEDEGP